MCPTDNNDINAYYVMHCVCYIINSINMYFRVKSLPLDLTKSLLKTRNQSCSSLSQLFVSTSYHHSSIFYQTRLKDSDCKSAKIFDHKIKLYQYNSIFFSFLGLSESSGNNAHLT